MINTEEWRNIPEAVGVDGALVTVAASAPAVFPLSDLGKDFEKSSYFSLLSIRRGDSWDDYATEASLIGLLMNGPALLTSITPTMNLDRLRVVFTRRSAEDEARTLGDWVWWFCAIDVHSQIITISPPWHETSELPFVRSVWPGWRVENKYGDRKAHFFRTGRELPPDLDASFELKEPHPSISPGECIRIIQEHIARTDEIKARVHSFAVDVTTELSDNGP